MSTAAQVAANIANAQFSTGPRTAEGKARASQNALKHGLDSREFILRPSEEAEYEAFAAAYAAEVNPQGALEEALFTDLVHARWNMKRVRRLEAEFAANGPDPLLDPERGKIADRLARHYTRFERSHRRLLAELRDMQTNRALRAELDRFLPEDLPAMLPIADFAERTQTVKNEYPFPRARKDRNFGNEPIPMTKKAADLRAAAFEA
jgi:hypothetical protein